MQIHNLYATRDAQTKYEATCMKKTNLYSFKAHGERGRGGGRGRKGG